MKIKQWAVLDVKSNKFWGLDYFKAVPIFWVKAKAKEFAKGNGGKVVQVFMGSI